MTDEEEKDIDLIERYHNGKLSSDELQSLKDRMAIDPSFKQKIEDFVDIFVGIRAQGENEFAREVEQWEKEIREEKSGVKFNWKIAAVVLALVAIGSTIVLLNNKNSDSLYAEYFTPYEDIITVRGSESVMEAYNKQNYITSAQQLQAYLMADPNNLNVRFYYGISLIASDHTELGIEALDKVISRNGMLKEQAEWYRALGLLRQGDIDKAKEQLRSIKPGHDYYQKATELIERL